MNMKIETPDNMETGPAKEGLINLDALSFDFYDEGSVRAFYDKKIQEMEDKENWLSSNKDRIKENKQRIIRMVEDGIIQDAQPETIWQFGLDKAKEGRERVVETQNKLEGRVGEIKDGVAKRLSRFLPDWSSGKATISFEMNERADFYIDGDKIAVDLGRLLFDKNPLEKVKEGITHEVFHFWMSEKNEWSDSRQDEMSDREIKERVIFRTIDEGLAVLISGQSLSEHHERQGRNYKEYIKESFDAFYAFIKEDNRERLENTKREEFKNMGRFYVVGNEIVKSVLQNEGLEKFRELIVIARRDPSVFLRKYQEIGGEKKILEGA